MSALENSLRRRRHTRKRCAPRLNSPVGRGITFMLSSIECSSFRHSLSPLRSDARHQLGQDSQKWRSYSGNTVSWTVSDRGVLARPEFRRRQFLSWGRAGRRRGGGARNHRREDLLALYDLKPAVNLANFHPLSWFDWCVRL